MFTASSPTVQSGPGRTLVLRVALGDLELDEKRSCWAHVARLGEWRGHPSGAFQIEQRHLQSIVDCFERSKSDELVFDYEHSSTIEGAEAPASGWVKRFEIRGDDLWAFVEWTERAASYIRAGEYRYASCVIFFDRPDKESGETVPARLHSVALTNTPFMDGLTAIALTETVSPAVALTSTERDRSMSIEKRVITDAIKAAPSDEMTQEQWTAWIAAWLGAAKKPDAPAKAPEVDASDKAPKRVQLADSARSLLQQIAALLKVEIDDSDDLFGAVYSALSALQSAAQVESMLTSAPAAMSDAAKALARSMRALSDSITAGDTPGNGVQQMADGDVIPPGAGGPSGDDAAAQAAGALAARLVEASGMDAVSALAALEANLGAVVSALKGEVAAGDKPKDESAMAATEAALKETSRKLALAETKLAALEPTVKSLSDRLAIRDKADADQARALRERTVETLVKSKQIPETARAAFVALGDKDPAAFAEQMKAFRVDLSDVPLGREASAQADSRQSAELDEKDPRVVALRQEWARKGFALTDSAIDPHRRMSAADREAARAQRKARQDVHIRAALAAQGG